MRDQTAGTAQEPHGVVVRRQALHVLRAGLHARDVRRRAAGVRQHQGHERPPLPLRLLGDECRAGRAQGPRMGIRAAVGRHGAQDHCRHRDRRAGTPRLPLPAQLRPLRRPLLGFWRRGFRRRQQPGVVVRGGQRLGRPGAVGRGDRRPQAARPRRFPADQRDRFGQPVLVRPRQAGAGAGVRQAVRQHGVRRQVRLQHLVDAGAAPDLRHQHAADHHRLDLSRQRTRST